MMTTTLRIALILVSVATMVLMMRKIRQAKLQIEAAIFWVLLAAVLFAFAVFPPLADFCAQVLGIYSTPNFLFLSMIFLLMVKLFTMTLQVSQMESKQKELVQKMALDAKEREELLAKLAAQEAELSRRVEELSAGKKDGNAAAKGNGASGQPAGQEPAHERRDGE